MSYRGNERRDYNGGGRQGDGGRYEDRGTRGNNRYDDDQGYGGGRRDHYDDRQGNDSRQGDRYDRGNDSRGSGGYDRGSDRGESRGSGGYGGSRQGGSQYGGSDRGRGGFRGGRGGRGGHLYNSDSGRSSGSSGENRPGVKPIAKKDLPFNQVVFAKRPLVMVQDKNLGTKLNVFANHAEIRLPDVSIPLYCYNIEVYENRKQLIKREEACPVFWSVFEKNRRSHNCTKHDVIFNDVNALYSVKKILSGSGTLFAPSSGPGRKAKHSIVYKFTGVVDFGAKADLDQQDEVLVTLIDAIATSRTRHPDEKLFTVFKRNTFFVDDRFDDKNIGGVQFSVPIFWGLDAKVGLSFAVKMNIRAGITSCFDLNHTLFSKPGYPLIRLLIELISTEPITDAEYEEVWDSRVRAARPDQRNIVKMKAILKNMTLTFNMHPALGMEYAKKKSQELSRNPAASRDINAPREFKFYDLTENSAENEIFQFNPPDNGPSRLMSIAEYFRDIHQITLRYPHLPCVMKKPNKKTGMRVMYPMEMVSYVGNPKRYEGFAPAGLLAELVKETSYTPNQRLMMLQHLMAQKPVEDTTPIIDNNDPIMKLHKLSIGKEMLTMKATLLPPPTVVYGNGKFTDTEHRGEWEAVRNEPVRTILEGGAKQRNGPKEKVIVGSIIGVRHPINPERSGVVKLDSLCYERIMRAIASTGQKIFWLDEEHGIPHCIDTFDYNHSTMKPQELYKYINTIKQHVETDKQYQSDDFVVVPLIFLVFDQKCSNFKENYLQNDYNLLKHLCDNMVGVYTQGMLADNFNTISENSATCRLTCHIVEKVLGKIGTTHRQLERGKSHKPWMTLTDPQSPTLVLGIDVCHPKASNRKASTQLAEDAPATALSIASVVGNIDFNMTQFRCSSRIQDAGEEQIVRMETQVMTRIEEFITNTKTRPAHIVVYRDGLCEGDFKRIMYEELNSIECACNTISGDFKPTITYILTSKRHRTKFFPMDPDASYEEHGFNVKPGTLVEDVVTSTKYFDFFLATQVGKMGTSSPTHYYVLHDTWAPMDSFWQTITHAFTYNFCRTTMTIGLPAPVMYAHLAAKRAKETFDAALYCEAVQGKTMSASRFEDVAHLTNAIHMNVALDGMVFV